MKHILILFLFTITSCSIFKHNSQNLIGNRLPSLENSEEELIISDDGASSVGSSLPYSDNKSNNIQSEDRVSSTQVSSLPYSKNKNNTQRNIEEVDQKFTNREVLYNNIKDRSSTGLIAYSVPSEMSVGKEYIVKIRISKDNNRTVLIIGDRKIPISDDSSNVSIEEITISPIMSANLISQKGNFEITSLSTELQNIQDQGYTEWSWAITPLKGGNNNLKLNIKIRVKEDGENYYKDITIFERKIKVKSNITYNISETIYNNWQWLIVIIIIPLIKWLISFYRKKDDNKST